MKRARGTALGLSLLFGLTVALASIADAQPAANPATPSVGTPTKLRPRNEAAGAKGKEGQVRVNHADRARYDSARGLFYLFGKVEFQDDEMKLFCDEASYNEKDDTAACAGNLRIVDQESVITGELINADFEAEVMKIQGNVKIETTKSTKAREKEEDEGKREKRVTTITCPEIEYTYTEGKRRARITGSLKAIQKDKTLLAQWADYDREKDIIVLGDEVTIKMENGNEFTCKKATISVTEDWVDMEPITGFFIRDKKKDEQKPPATPSETPAPAPPAPQG